MLISLIVNAEITDCYGFNVLATQLKKLQDVNHIFNFETGPKYHESIS